MIDQFAAYLDAVDVTKTLRRRIAEFLGYYEAIGVGPIRDIFVTDLVTQEGGRQFEVLWIFTDEATGEAALAGEGTDFDWAPIRGQVRRWAVKLENYDLRKATDASRMSVEASIGASDSAFGGLLMQMKASGLNCDYLTGIIQKWVIPNGRMAVARVGGRRTPGSIAVGVPSASPTATSDRPGRARGSSSGR